MGKVGVERARGQFAGNSESFDDPNDHRIPSPSCQAKRGEFRDRLIATLDKLPPQQKMAISLRYLEEYSYREIMNEMELSKEAVSGCLRRSLKGLKTLAQNDLRGIRSSIDHMMD